MALKVELTRWVSGVEAYESGNFEAALTAFEGIADTSKIHFNIGMTFIQMQILDEAIGALTRAVACDPFLAVAYFMRGVCLYNSNALQDSLADFSDALTYLRGNALIDYSQLGLSYKLLSCEVSFNRGLCLAALGQMDAAYKDFDDALRSRPSDSSGDFRNIEDAVQMGEEAPDRLGPYAVPPDLVYRPPKGKVKNSDKKDYIGKAKVVASVEATDNYAGFSGRELKLKTLPRSATFSGGGGGGPARSATLGGTSPLTPSSATSPLSRSATVGAFPRSPGPNSFAASASRSPGLGGPMPFGSRSNIIPAGGPTLARRPTNNSGGPGTLRSRTSSLSAPRPDPPSRYTSNLDTINPIDDLMDSLGSARLTNDPPSSRYNPPPFSQIPQRAPSAFSSSTSQSSIGTDRIKLKAHFTDTRILLIPYDITLPDLESRIQTKFKSRDRLLLKYKDEDGEMMGIADQEDLEVAFVVSGMDWGQEGGSGRLEVWCFVE
ncbi:hypothetical protein DFS34DRAFT_717945 [Phlyctochytrium arcticum]|nr:hypothetical protein DFS34DRAFT_445939 [Phlyctochytrium arcticum]KAI9091810.1 hypothetical protein DFS34DRAFT_717945 [Phlyctochytrium arcticum]